MPETTANPINTSAVQLRSVLARPPALFNCVVWSPDGSKVASGSGDCTVRVWDADRGKLLRTLEGHEEGITSVAWTGDGRRLASGSNDGTVRVWDAESGELLRTLEGHRGRVRSVAWSGDGRRLASGSNDGTVCVWDAESGEELVVYELGHPVYELFDVSFQPALPIVAAMGRPYWEMMTSSLPVLMLIQGP